MTIFHPLLPKARRWVAAALVAPACAFAAGNAPDQPDNLQGSITGTQVTLNWDVPADDDEVQGYNVYIDNQYANTVLENTYTGPVTEGKLTTFYVVAFDSPPRSFSQPSTEIMLPDSLIPDDLTIPPSSPTNLAGTLSDGQIMLSWTASTDDEAVQGYNLYRDNRYLTTVSENSYTGPNAEDDLHAWYVVAFDIRKNFSARSDTLRLPDRGPVDTTIAPTVPTGLQGSVTTGLSHDDVFVTWQASSDDQAVAGYNVYINGDYVTTRFSTDYETQVDPGTSNVFQIVAFDFDDNFSSSSQTLTLPLGSAPTDPGSPPSVPTELTSSIESNSTQSTISLNWRPSSGPVSVSGYNIYRDNAYLTTVRTNSYVDTITAGIATTYSVVAFDNFGNYSSRSERLSILASINQPPFFASLNDQDLIIDERWELVLKPVDVDGDPAGILVSDPPSGMEFVDNGDGTRSLLWTPGIDDVGIYDIEVIAFDLNDTDLRTSQTIQLSVLTSPPVEPTPFELQIPNQAYNLVEGSAQGLDVVIDVARLGSFDGNINLSVATETAADEDQLTVQLSEDTLDTNTSSSTLNVKLAIGPLPLLPEQRRLVITATSEDFIQQTTVKLAVTPVARDDVYLLIGQSNMVGYSEREAKRKESGEPDEPNSRIIQANVAANDHNLIINPELFIDEVFTFGIPPFAAAEDPLHIPFDALSGRKSGSRIGMGLSFAKTALPFTTRNIVLVPSAWSGSSFCDNGDPAAHWNATETSNPELGNTLMFDRALQRVNETLLATGGILRGILWHQGESDSTSACAAAYQDNLIALVEGYRTRIITDARGDSARGVSADIPFIAGTMSKGQDDESDYSQFTSSKLVIDSIHRNIGSVIPYSAITNNDDLVPTNGYPCGSDSCVHFGAAALREMGARSYDSLLRAIENK